MCVIAFIPKGVQTPTEKLKDMWDTNPDGAGYAYVKGREVVYRKGFMTYESLMKDLEKHDFTNTNLAIHFRIGTSGKNDRATCHPFPISNNFGELRKTRGKVGAVLFHNGILSDGGMANPLSSDTQDFVVATYPLFKKYNKSKCRDYFIEQLVEGSRVLVMYADGRYKMYGSWEKDEEIYVSNSNYQWKSWSGLYGGGYAKEDERLPAYPHFNFERVQTKTAERIWDTVLKNGFAYLSPNEFEELKNSCEQYCSRFFEADGYKLGVDEELNMVWVEDTPVKIKEMEY